MNKNNEKSKKIFYVYMLLCKNKAYYTGYTTDLKRRFKEHLAGHKKCKYTQRNPPRSVAAYWKLESTLSQTLRIEWAIKKLSSSKKKELSQSPETIRDLLKKLNILYSPK